MSEAAAFEVEVVERGEILVTGIKVKTSLDKAGEDCPALWQNFAQRMPEAGGLEMGESFGVSSGMEENGAFEYWATVPAYAANVPDGMDSMRLPAGLYARCKAPSLQQVSEAYAFLYSEWGVSQVEYAVNFTAPCFERYAAEYFKDGSFEIFVPVTRK